MHKFFAEAVYNLHTQQSIKQFRNRQMVIFVKKYRIVIERRVALYLYLVKADHNTTFCSTRNISDLV